jgi:parallel beta-helix repeat protein
MNRSLSTAPFLLALAVSAAALAGPLTPPAGPVASTMKTLADVEPRTAINATSTPGDATCTFKITTGGSYYLTGDILGATGKAAITIANPSELGVTIDLNGFKISGGSSAINASVVQDSVTVRNGIIVAPAGAALDLANTDRLRAQGVTIFNPGTYGITGGHSCFISDCHVYGGTTCISVWQNSIVKDCTTSSAGANGFWCATSCELSNCTAENCSNDGFFLAGAHTTCTHCAAAHCTQHSFETGNWDVLESCTSSYAGSAGFLVGAQGTIRDCLSENGAEQGIIVQGGCTVVNNQCNSSGAGCAGIWVQGNSNDVEGNTLVSNGYGIYVSGMGNLIVRNRATQNPSGNYSIGNGNSYGPLVNASTSAAWVTGSSAPGTLGSTDPNANLSY